jgi:hypothetical protein
MILLLLRSRDAHGSYFASSSDLFNIYAQSNHVNIMTDSLPLCDRCKSPVTDSIEVEIENHGKVKLGKHTSGSWTCNDCLMKKASEETHSTISTIRNDINIIHHEHLGAASKTDVSPNTPTADDADV